jgi:DNA modification methylase
MGDDVFLIFLTDMFKQAYKFTKDSAAIYVCHATRTYPQFLEAFLSAGFKFSQLLIWLKERILLTMGQDFQRVYEPIIYGWKDGEKRFSNYFNNEKEVMDPDKFKFEERLDVWFEARDKSKDYVHPTQEPLKLIARAIRKSCPPDGLVLDLFGGSGSTTVSAHQMGRMCYSMELDPLYCDVIVKRMRKLDNSLNIYKNGELMDNEE